MGNSIENVIIHQYTKFENSTLKKNSCLKNFTNLCLKNFTNLKFQNIKIPINQKIFVFSKNFILKCCSGGSNTHVCQVSKDYLQKQKTLTFQNHIENFYKFKISKHKSANKSKNSSFFEKISWEILLRMS